MEDLLPSMILYVNFQTTTKNVALKTLKIMEIVYILMMSSVCMYVTLFFKLSETRLSFCKRLEQEASSHNAWMNQLLKF